jgi:hypothetical protein
MSGQAAPEHDRRPRLNPFAFPSDTTFRFVLLVVAVLGSTLYVWNWIYAAVGDHAARFARASRDCLTEDPARFTGLDEFTASSGAFTRCVQASNRPIAWWMLGGLALVAVLAVVLTLAQPWWRRRRLRLKPLRQEDAPAVVDEVAALAREAGLREPPALSGTRSTARRPGSRSAMSAATRARSPAGSSSGRRSTPRRSGRSCGTSSRTSATATST